jgi:raffinose/stachyose/melibiose transport system substrate-binding protein
MRSGSGRRGYLPVATVTAALLCLYGLGASAAQPARSSRVTISAIAIVNAQPAFDVLVRNFERVYPGSTVEPTYAATTAGLYQVVATELAAGSGPDLIPVFPGCGTPISVCELARDGYLAPILDAPWTRRSLSVITSASKYGQGLFVFSPSVQMFGIFTNDTLFSKLGLNVPQTFSQLLADCQKAKADDVTPVLLGASGSLVIQYLVGDGALTTVYQKDPHWLAQLKAGQVSFEDTPGWHQALQELVDMSNAGCIEPGAAGTTSPQADAEFAQGQALMMVNITSHKGVIDAANPQFTYSQHPFPAGTDPSKTVVLLSMGNGWAVNARSSAANQATAQEFANFLARPEQDALYVKILGGVTQYQFLKGQIPAYLSSFAPLFASHEYGLNPVQTWWNADVGTALSTYGEGLLTGQESIDDVLNAMDAAWKEGPS